MFSKIQVSLAMVHNTLDVTFFRSVKCTRYLISTFVHTGRMNKKPLQDSTHFHNQSVGALILHLY